MKHPWVKRLASFLVLLLFFGFLFYYVGEHGEDFAKSFRLDWRFTGLMFALYLTLLFINGLVLHSLVNKLSGNLTVTDGLFLSALTQFTNYFLPLRGGTLVRAAWLKKVHDFDFTKYVAILGGYYATLFLVVSAATLLTSAYLYRTENILNVPTTFIYGALFIFLLAITHYDSKHLTLPKWVPEVVPRVLEGWHALKGDSPLVKRLLLFNGATIVVGTLLIEVFFLAMGTRLPFSHALFLHLVPYLSFFLNITPASVGVYDSAFLLSAAVLGISITDAILFVGVFRAVSLVGSACVVFAFGAKHFWPATVPGKR